MRVRDTPRASDDQVLAALCLRQHGLSWPKIAKALGLASYQTIQQLCRNVAKADAAESGEDVMGAYK